MGGSARIQEFQSFIFGHKLFENGSQRSVGGFVRLLVRLLNLLLRLFFNTS